MVRIDLCLCLKTIRSFPPMHFHVWHIDPTFLVVDPTSNDYYTDPGVLTDSDFSRFSSQTPYSFRPSMIDTQSPRAVYRVRYSMQRAKTCLS